MVYFSYENYGTRWVGEKDMDNKMDFSKLSDEEKDEVMNNICENLPILRKKSGMTQDDLAKQLGVTRQTIVNIESKKTKLNWAMSISIIMFFMLNSATIGLLLPLGILTKSIFKNIPILGGIASFLDTKFKND